MTKVRLTIVGIEPKASATNTAKKLKKVYKYVRVEKIFRDKNSNQYGIYVGGEKSKLNGGKK